MDQQEQQKPEIPTMAFLGPEGSFSYQAAIHPSVTTITKVQHDNLRLKKCATIEQVFDEVRTGQARRGIVPFENSTNGSVSFTIDSLGKCIALEDDLVVCGEVAIAVKLCLLGHTGEKEQEDEQQKKGQEEKCVAQQLGKIKRVYSHPQAWSQCERFLQDYLKDVERINVDSTAAAAEIVKSKVQELVEHAGEAGHEKSMCESAALASDYVLNWLGGNGFGILANVVADIGNMNVTRFVVVEKMAAGELQYHNSGDRLVSNEEMDREKGDIMWSTLIGVLDQTGHDLDEALEEMKRCNVAVTAVHGGKNGVAMVELQERSLKNDTGGLYAWLEDHIHSSSFKFLGSWVSPKCLVL